MRLIDASNFVVEVLSSRLGAFAKLDNFWDLFEIAFGKEYDQAAALILRSQWQVGDFREPLKKGKKVKHENQTQ